MNSRTTRRFVVGAFGMPHRDKLTHPLLTEDLYVGLVEHDESVIGVRWDTGDLSWSDNSRLVAHACAQSAAHDPRRVPRRCVSPLPCRPSVR